MNIIHTALKAMFGKSWEVTDLQLAFHKEANLHGEHGLILASHRKYQIDGEAVRFVFVGLSSPPPMTPRILEYIWEEARAQGFIPHALITYGNVLKTNDELEPQQLVRSALANAMTGPFGEVGKTMPAETKALMEQHTDKLMKRNRQVAHMGMDASASDNRPHRS